MSKVLGFGFRLYGVYALGFRGFRVLRFGVYALGFRGLGCLVSVQ